MKNPLFRPRSLFIVALLVVPVLVMFALWGSWGGSRPDGTSEDGVETSASMSNANLLKKAVINMRKLKSYHLKADIETVGLVTTTLEGDLDIANSEYRLEMATGGIEFQVIGINGESYMSADGGAFTKSLAGASLDESIKELNSSWGKLTSQDIETIKDKLHNGTPPTEVINGLDTRHIVGDVVVLKVFNTTSTGSIPNPDSITEGTIELWISTEQTPYVVQMRTDSFNIDMDHKSKGTLTWSNFNEDFDIQAPPVSNENDTPTDPTVYLLTATPVPAPGSETPTPNPQP